MKEPRWAYTWKASLFHPGETPGGEVEESVKAVVRHWNATMPKNRVELVENVRFRLVVECLKVWNKSHILQAIDYYSSNAYNVKHKLFKSYDGWFLPHIVAGWYERAVEAQEAKEARKPTINASTQVEAALRAITDKHGRALTPFEALIRPEQQRLWREAVDYYRQDWISKGGDSRTYRRPAHAVIEAKAIEIMEHEKIAKSV